MQVVCRGTERLANCVSLDFPALPLRDYLALHNVANPCPRVGVVVLQRLEDIRVEQRVNSQPDNSGMGTVARIVRLILVVPGLTCG